MKPPLFTYEEIEVIGELAFEAAQDDPYKSILLSIVKKCDTTTTADPRFRLPHK